MRNLLRTLSICWPLLVAAATIAQAPAPPAADSDLPLVEWKDAANYYDREVVVYGRIVLTRNIGTYSFLNFHTDFRRHFTALVKQEHFQAFPTPPEQMYMDKFVAVRGKVIKYREKPEIVIESPAQIVILPDAAGDVAEVLRNQLPPGWAEKAAPNDVAPAPGQAPVTGLRGLLTVAEVNLGNLLRAHPDLCSGDNMSGGTMSPGIKQAVEVLENFNADIVAVQWGEKLDCLNRFNHTLIPDLKYSFVAGKADAQGRVACALLSRFALSGGSTTITQFQNRKGETVDFRRPPIVGEVHLGGATLTLMVVQMPSSADKMKVPERNAEIKALRKLIDGATSARPGANVLVFGGFAGTVDSKAMSLLVGQGDQALSIPGYDPPAKKTDPKPTIAQVSNFILANQAAAALYAPASTKVERGEILGSAASLSLQLASPQAVLPPPSGPAPPAQTTKDDF